LINRLSKLYELQYIDDQLDELEELRGDLPLTVNELTGQMNTVKEQIEEQKEAKIAAQEKMKLNETEKEELQEKFKKFKAQLYQVRNNKEYDALTKSIDHSESRIKEIIEENAELENEAQKRIHNIEELEPAVDDLKQELKEKEAELKKIIKANEKEEVKLQKSREKLVPQLQRAEYKTYMRIRKARGGSAISVVVRGACSGCHNVIPPQRQIEIRANKRLYTCESCGRVLISGGIADNVKGKLG